MINKGSQLWDDAKRVIPGGNQLLSKRSERFLPGLWPAYYSKAKGCEVWDIEGRKYYDFAQMGVGSCVLGYADEDVNQAVIKAVNEGSMCTLNAPEEVQLANKLIEIHPWAEMARFARTGGEACAIAIRIARNASKREKIAFCGYHGWHDWYLAANLSHSDTLKDHLLPGLKSDGVPRGLTGSISPFYYNQLETLEKLVSEHGQQIGVIIMEPVRNMLPDEGFLEGVRDIANRINAVLIFDEITSGFRLNVGAAHMNYDVSPDIAVFGKALGNGYPISAIIGVRNVMDAAQDTFISSTMWTERIGFVAALATLEKMEKYRVPESLITYGKLINSGWQMIAKKHDIKIHISGIDPLTHISFEHENPLAIQTYYSQEMLKKGFLLGASVYTTYAYNEQIISQFIEASDGIFANIANILKTDNIVNHLHGTTIDPGFKRLTYEVDPKSRTVSLMS